MDHLIEKDVFPIGSLGSILLENAFGGNAMLGAELLPEFHADLVSALSHLDRYDFTRHFRNELRSSAISPMLRSSKPYQLGCWV